jgi:hypothetical protein
MIKWLILKLPFSLKSSNYKVSHKIVRINSIRTGCNASILNPPIRTCHISFFFFHLNSHFKISSPTHKNYSNRIWRERERNKRRTKKELESESKRYDADITHASESSSFSLAAKLDLFSLSPLLFFLFFCFSLCVLVCCRVIHHCLRSVFFFLIVNVIILDNCCVWVN